VGRRITKNVAAKREKVIEGLNGWIRRVGPRIGGRSVNVESAGRSRIQARAARESGTYGKVLWAKEARGKRSKKSTAVYAAVNENRWGKEKDRGRVAKKEREGRKKRDISSRQKTKKEGKPPGLF